MAIYNQSDVDYLNLVQSKQNDGRGINCVRTIITYLNKGDFESAKAVRVNDGDKIASYPEVEKLICDIFGCRTHGKHNCTSWMCVTK